MARNKTYDLPQNPGFIGGIFWPGVLTSFACRIVALQIVVTYVAMVALKSGIVVHGPHADVFGIPLYAPWHLVGWYLEYWRVFFFEKTPFHWALIWALPAIFASQLFMGALPNFLFRSRIKRYAKHQDQLYGSQRWATMDDLQEGRLLDGEGLLLGAFEHNG